jgi:hypothetical protein
MRVRWVGHLECMGEMRNALQILAENSEGDLNVEGVGGIKHANRWMDMTSTLCVQFLHFLQSA